MLLPLLYTQFRRDFIKSLRWRNRLAMYNETVPVTADININMNAMVEQKRSPVPF